ncbi:hypothetical protein [Umezawaea sp. Da 62-37]|uniref:hypothetical protein n=1 Tax=Umezawaea sp. Da 62-37 TaxID=3075927 RepID=UPI0028F6F2B7|nr:hypothetical protein [Umezawaea sp. Da 62-37]WNV85885.1 hypothetical protein RM788_48535 [Umezawaea sp. Da 62-37]
MIWSKPPSRTILCLRLLLSAIFLVYGSVKLLGGQYYYGDWTISKSTADGTSLVWAFYGYSPFYGRMTGLFEFIPAAMLLFRRTTFAGAAALFAVGLNITLMDFGFDYPLVKYLAAVYTAVLAFLVVQDRAKLTALFRDPAEGEPRTTGGEERPA